VGRPDSSTTTVPPVTPRPCSAIPQFGQDRGTHDTHVPRGVGEQDPASRRDAFQQIAVGMAADLVLVVTVADDPPVRRGALRGGSHCGGKVVEATDRGRGQVDLVERGTEPGHVLMCVVETRHNTAAAQGHRARGGQACVIWADVEDPATEQSHDPGPGFDAGSLRRHRQDGGVREQQVSDGIAHGCRPSAPAASQANKARNPSVHGVGCPARSTLTTARVPVRHPDLVAMGPWCRTPVAPGWRSCAPARRPPPRRA
jgi:hypothetical protein